jgi:hypothetical protein
MKTQKIKASKNILTPKGFFTRLFHALTDDPEPYPDPESPKQPPRIDESFSSLPEFIYSLFTPDLEEEPAPIQHIPLDQTPTLKPQALPTRAESPSLNIQFTNVPDTPILDQVLASSISPYLPRIIFLTNVKRYRDNHIAGYVDMRLLAMEPHCRICIF